MRYLADTQTFLWFVMGDESLSKKHRSLIADAANEILVSIASLWEIAIKVSIGKLDLKMTFISLIEDHLDRFTWIPIEPEHLIELERLPYHHRDPFDRIMIAQSIVENLEVLTSDSKFKLYPIQLVR